MESRATIKRIGLTDVGLIEDFLRFAGDSLTSFRYFDKRPLTVVADHIVTLIMVRQSDGRPVGYGHLDKAENGVWLGIAISEQVRGQGLGTELMRTLVDYARHNLDGVVRLSVDEGNVGAIALYKKFGFISKGKINDCSLLMELALSK